MSFTYKRDRMMPLEALAASGQPFTIHVEMGPTKIADLRVVVRKGEDDTFVIEPAPV